MTVAELIKDLQEMPSEAEVFPLYDGFCKIELSYVYLSKGKEVILINQDAVVYITDDRPENAPTKEEKRHWSTPSIEIKDEEDGN